MARKSDFTYHTTKARGIDILVIIDLDQGGMSVTNNVEAVVRSITAELGESIYERPIIYRDSAGTYDGIDGTYMEDPFYSIGGTDEDRAAAKAAERYWEQNKIRFIGARAWRRSGSDESITVPEKLLEIQSLWAEWSKEYGDVGSCVLGAGFEFDFEGQRYEMPPAGPWQGSCSWEASKDQIEERLEEAGATNITYHWGNMD
ncbi:MAG: hypothetical protein PHE09_15140 [Oscillospiraceae bacterium]|nr:hypothetical protein [Oscillospiraceae bacterium]